ncbi:MAG: hypothetical protein ACK4MS_10605 [Paracoccaceae bacterium]
MKRDTKVMLAGFDAARNSAPDAVRMARPLAVVPARRELSVLQALEWAFGVERVSLDFNDLPQFHVGVDTIWCLMQRGHLGCRVDGGGRSAAHVDAEVIASFLAALPEGQGGRGMAAAIADMARAGRVPRLLEAEERRCVPVAWRANKHGMFGVTERVGVAVTVFRGRRVEHEVLACPVTYTCTMADVMAARRFWMRWRGALAHLRHDLVTVGGLRSITLTDDLPPATPWVGC